MTPMTTKEEVLRLLQSSQGEYISGEDLAQRLNVSRNAVWRAVKALQGEGCAIEAVTNRGYCLTRTPEALTLAGISRYLPQNGDWDIRVYPTISSTNTVLKEMAEHRAKEGTILIANEQTAGKGRMSRPFYSPAGTGVYLSFLLRPTFSPQKSLYITTAAAVAVAEAIEAVSDKAAMIKWVNDVYLDGKKTCGILTEASFDMENRQLAYAVLGIGINLREPVGGFPEELRPIVTSVFNDATYSPDGRDRLVAELISRFWGFYRHLTDKPFLKSYQERSLLRGRDVYVINGSEKTPAHALDVDDEFRIHVRYEDGHEEWIQSGEISVKPRTNFS